jgi:hypothetical protein
MSPQSVQAVQFDRLAAVEKSVAARGMSMHHFGRMAGQGEGAPRIRSGRFAGNSSLASP